MRRCPELLPHLLATGLLVACFATSSKGDEARQGGKVQVEQPKEITNAEAQCDIAIGYASGWDYKTGKEAQPNLAEAVKWYLKAADQGSTRALSHLASIYGDEQSPLHDPKKSFEFTRR